VWNEAAGEMWTQWRHWRCVPPQQFKKMYENWSVTELPGYKKLSDEYKAQVRKAYAAGRAEPASASAEKEEAKKEVVKEPTPEPEGPEAIAFKVDVATRAAMCRAPSCIEGKKKVEPGELRLGIIYDDKKSTWMYKHW